MEAMSASERIEKPWGHEIIWAHTNQYVGKVLHILKGHQLSLQYHKQKDETIYVLSGRLSFTVGCAEDTLRTIIMEPGARYHIVPGLIHRMEAIETTDVLEVSTPELDDVVRLRDAYGRV